VLTLAAIRRLSLAAWRLLVPAKYVPDAGSYSEYAQCFVRSQGFADPRDVLSQEYVIAAFEMFCDRVLDLAADT